MDIDGNRKALGANDAKFFMLSLNPSQSEQMHLIGRKVDDFKELAPQEKKRFSKSWRRSPVRLWMNTP